MGPEAALSQGPGLIGFYSPDSTGPHGSEIFNPAVAFGALVWQDPRKDCHKQQQACQDIIFQVDHCPYSSLRVMRVMRVINTIEPPHVASGVDFYQGTWMLNFSFCEGLPPVQRLPGCHAMTGSSHALPHNQFFERMILKSWRGRVPYGCLVKVYVFIKCYWKPLSILV